MILLIGAGAETPHTNRRIQEGTGTIRWARVPRIETSFIIMIVLGGLTQNIEFVKLYTDKLREKEDKKDKKL